jgi:transposase-like protein
MTEWSVRLLDSVYPVMFVDDIHVKIRDGQVANRPFWGPLPISEQAALKFLYLATRAPNPTGRERARWVARWKVALNAFAFTFGGRITASMN